MPDFSLNLRTTSYSELEKFALLAHQEYNFGNAADWFGEFLDGLHGFYARVYAVQVHYKLVHSWLPGSRLPTETEYHLSSILFGMDSAIECLTFALNALGFGISQSDFRDITDKAALRRINPQDLVGIPAVKPPKAPLPGYALFFPSVQAAWQRKMELLEVVKDLHDVSKHRKTVYVGGLRRNDPPDRFFESLGVGEEAVQRALYWPSAEIILKHSPKLPAVSRIPQPVGPGELLEDITPEFMALLEETGDCAINDVRTTVRLKETKLRE